MDRDARALALCAFPTVRSLALTSGGVGDTPTSERSSVLQATRAKESRKYVTVTIHNDDRIAGDIIYSEIPFEIQKKKNRISKYFSWIYLDGENIY